MAKYLLTFLVIFLSIKGIASSNCFDYFSSPNNSIKTILLSHQVRILSDLFKSERAPNSDKLAKEIGVSPGVISHLRTGTTIFSIPRAIQVSRIFKISVWDLIGSVSDFKRPGSLDYSVFKLTHKSVKNNLSNNNSDLKKEVLKAQVEHLKLLRFMFGKNLNHTDFAQALGLSSGAISHIFTGKTFLSLEDAVIMAKLFNVDPRIVLIYAEAFDGFDHNQQKTFQQYHGEILTQDDPKSLVSIKKPSIRMNYIDSFLRNFTQTFSTFGFSSLNSEEQKEVFKIIQNWTTDAYSSNGILYAQMYEDMYLSIKDGDMEKLDFYSNILSLNYEFQNHSNMTILQAAIYYNNLTAIELLLNRGVDIHYVNKDGYNSLNFAVQHDKFEAHNVLLSHTFTK